MKKLLTLLLALALTLALPILALAEESAEVAETAEAAVEEVATEASADTPAVSPVFKKLTEVPWYSLVILALLVVMGVGLSLASKNGRWDSRRISMGAMCIAIAFVLSCIRLFRMPQGGSITPAAMLPLVWDRGRFSVPFLTALLPISRGHYSFSLVGCPTPFGRVAATRHGAAPQIFDLSRRQSGLWPDRQSCGLPPRTAIRLRRCAGR